MRTANIVYALKVKRYQLDHCGAVRPWNIRNADIHMYRMLHRELRKREGLTLFPAPGL
ncbi:hypothetical protein ABCR94_38900 [Streptomyces sp. 21So2-11]|uniref:hypothetical protein n=1 Tax=Streptomyces sp. 21So2-11 TaxID=3144408 RepID=UPI00321AFD24